MLDRNVTPGVHLQTVCLLASNAFDINDRGNDWLDFELAVRCAMSSGLKVNSQAITFRERFALIDTFPECFIFYSSIKRCSPITEVPRGFFNIRARDVIL